MKTHHRTLRQGGFSLIELMIASLIGLILLGGLVRVMTGTSSSHRDVTRAGQLLENGRYATQLLTREIEHAGFYDQFDAAEVPAATPDPCATSLTALTNDMGVAVQGLDAQSAGFSLPSCIEAANYRAGTDILVVRRASTTATPAAGLVATDVYLQGRYDDYVLDTGANAASFTLSNPMSTATLPIRKYRVDIFFVSPCRDFSGGACQDEIPTLKRMELTAGPSFAPVTLAEGIEDLQLYFGVDTLPAGAPDGAPDRNAAGKLYVASPGDITTSAGRAAWANVVGVQLYLLARDVERSAGYQDTKTYVLSPGEIAPAHQVAGNDTPFKRHVFSSQIRVVNPSSRRES